MNVAIVGSRSFDDYARLTKCIEEVLAERGIIMSEVVLVQRATPLDSISYLAKATNRPPRPMASQRLFKTPMESYDVAGKTG